MTHAFTPLYLCLEREYILHSQASQFCNEGALLPTSVFEVVDQKKKKGIISLLCRCYSKKLLVGIMKENPFRICCVYIPT